MKICFINPTLGRRVMAYELARELSRSGHEISIIQPTKKEESVIQEGPLKIYQIKSFFLPKIRYTIPPLIKEYKLLKKLSQDVDFFQVASYIYPICWPALLMKFRLKKPVIITADILVGISWYYGSLFTDLVGKIYTYTIGLILFLLSDVIIVLHSKILNDIRRLVGKKKKILVIPNGISKDFEPKDDIVKKLKIKLDLINRPVIIYVGRLVTVKRIDFLLKIFEEVMKKSKKAKLLIIGDGPNSYTNRYRNLASHLGSSVVFLGRIDLEKLPSYIGVSDLVVLTSKSEGLPRVLIEAGKCRKPVVSSLVGGVEDIVEHNKTGFLASRDNLSEHVDYIIKILDNPKLGQELGQAAFDKVTQKFNWEKIVDKYNKIYQELK